MNTYYIYILTNSSMKALYTGITSDLRERISEHKNKKYPNSFSAKYSVDRLVYFETYNEVNDAIAREKQLKGGSRKKKVDLIISFNPDWKDLYFGL